MNNIGILMASHLKRAAVDFIKEMRQQGVSDSDIAVMARYMPFFLNGVNDNLFGVNINISENEFENKV